MTSVPQTGTDFLILRVTPYSETSLVVAGLSPDLGQLHFLVRGARRLTRRQFPMVDLFRLLHVRFRHGRGDLHTWQAADLVQDFSGVAGQMAAFETAGWLARFALANVPEGLAQPRFFAALLVAFGRLALPLPEWLSPEEGTAALKVGTCLVYLQENGLLPDFAQDADIGARCRLLLAMGAGERDLPVLAAGSWLELWRWTLALLHRAECDGV